MSTRGRKGVNNIDDLPVKRVAALLAAMPQEHERAPGAWQAELAEWPLLPMAVDRSVRAMASALPQPQADPARMRANLVLDIPQAGLTADTAARSASR